METPRTATEIIAREEADRRDRAITALRLAGNTAWADRLEDETDREQREGGWDDPAVTA